MLGAQAMPPGAAPPSQAGAVTLPHAVQAKPSPAPLPPKPPPVEVITLDQAIQLALDHSPALAAARTQIPQSQADEITAALRPNPVASGQMQYFPLRAQDFTLNYLNNVAEFDGAVAYTVERGHKRQARVTAAKDVTQVVRSQVADAARGVSSAVAQQFIAALLAKSSLAFAQQNLDSWQNTLSIGEMQYRAGAVSEGDLDTLRLQTLQYQTTVSGARLGLVQALSELRQQIGFAGVPANFGVAGDLVYQPLHGNLDDMKALALRHRPDLIAAQRSIAAAESAHRLALANGKRDLTLSLTYAHASGASTFDPGFSIDIPVFDRNQGEIARTAAATTQAEELARQTEQQVLTDVATAFEAVQQDAQIVGLYTSGYRQQAKQALDIRQYSYRQGASSLLDLLDAERTYRSTELGYRQALANYMLALEQLKTAVGTRTLP